MQPRNIWLLTLAAMTVASAPAVAQNQKRPNIVILMTDDTGWNDFGAYSGGGAALGHPTPNVDSAVPLTSSHAVRRGWTRGDGSRVRPSVRPTGRSSTRARRRAGGGGSEIPRGGPTLWGRGER
jgi:hypothetical protein